MCTSLTALSRLATLLVTALSLATCCWAQPVTSPREMLDIMRIDASQRKHFVDDRPLNDELETLGRLLFRLPNFSATDLDRWSGPIQDIASMLSNTDSYRFEIYDVEGQISNLLIHDVLPESVPRLGFRRYYEVSIEQQGVSLVIYTRTIPQRWIKPATENPQSIVGENIRAQALLLKRGSSENAGGTLVFAASRLNWYPTEPSALLKTTPDQVLLGQLGLDIDRLTEVVHRSKMTGEDRECFYQALAAVRLAEPDQLARVGRTEFDIAKLIRTPELAGGELYTLHGLARRAIMIKVEDPDIQTRFGIDRYYELEVFLPLERQVRFVDPDETKDQTGKLFTEYPFVVCVPELPTGMELGDDIREPVSFSAFFLKLWAYETEFMSGGRARTAKPRLQQSPLFVGPTVIMGEQYQPRKSVLSLYIACLFVGLMLTSWVILWRSSIQDKNASKRLFRKHEPDEGAFDSLSS